MTQTTSRFFDDIARLVTDAAGAAQGLRREVDSLVRAQMDRLMQSMDVVKREEFEAVRDMAVKAREENDALAARLAALERRLASDKPGEARTGPTLPGQSAAAGQGAARPRRAAGQGAEPGRRETGQGVHGQGAAGQGKRSS